ncbi:SHOCT domain-containing protein [Lentzea flaviverrucosa]|uniref:Putative membrane protein n=1 Tax=Lentzea flaviverrucosa TaxID=200379 RepID=A0A1H9XWE7_9PSEU|nr:SHOCT domain-containing protein [Lentzea flaviverrucosa]RDI34324.1 putative membrane protein [Lentzea flaviverrucosa]SES50505.1 putative membrane protein [Lentzea flaviverrucosa]
MYYGTPMGWGGIVLMTLGMIAFWSVLLTVAVVLLRRRDEHGGSALRILEERLARGDIDTDEFDRVRKTLRSR